MTIDEPAPVTAPTASNALQYTGQAQHLLASPATTNVGDIQYSVTDATATAPGKWSEAVPVATNAGSYKVCYRANVTDPDEVIRYFNSEPAYVTVSIGQQTPVVTSWPSAEIYVGDTLENSHLTGGGASVSGTFSVGAEQSWDTAGTHSARQSSPLRIRRITPPQQAASPLTRKSARPAMWWIRRPSRSPMVRP